MQEERLLQFQECVSYVLHVFHQSVCCFRVVLKECVYVFHKCLELLGCHDGTCRIRNHTFEDVRVSVCVCLCVCVCVCVSKTSSSDNATFVCLSNQMHVTYHQAHFARCFTFGIQPSNNSEQGPDSPMT
jgi:hypothetical protein